MGFDFSQMVEGWRTGTGYALPVGSTLVGVAFSGPTGNSAALAELVGAMTDALGVDRLRNGRVRRLVSTVDTLVSEDLAKKGVVPVQPVIGRVKGFVKDLSGPEAMFAVSYLYAAHGIVGDPAEDPIAPPPPAPPPETLQEAAVNQQAGMGGNAVVEGGDHPAQREQQRARTTDKPLAVRHGQELDLSTLAMPRVLEEAHEAPKVAEAHHDDEHGGGGDKVPTGPRTVTMTQEEFEASRAPAAKKAEKPAAKGGISPVSVGCGCLLAAVAVSIVLATVAAIVAVFWPG